MIDQSIIGVSSASLISSVSASILLVFYWKHTIAHRLLLYLTLSDVLSMAFKIASIMLPLSEYSCFAFLTLYSFFLQCASVWTCIIGFHMWWTSEMRAPIFPLEVMYFFVSLLIPTAYVIGIVTGGDIYFREDNNVLECNFVITSRPVIIGFSVTRIGFFVFNLGIICIIIFKVWRARTWTENLKKSKTMTLFFIQICFLVNTVSSFLVIGEHLTRSKLEAEIIMTQVQGLLNSIVVCRKYIIRWLSPVIKYFKAKSFIKMGLEQTESKEMGSSIPSVGCTTICVTVSEN